MTTREVELSGGAPWGFRMHGGSDQNQPLRISRRYSDSLEQSLEVNPGRKASLSGIREGDVISSINGRPTKGMSNADAHAMLRCAGPVLRLGLNEDKEMSPRRRSIGKGSELKRPSQLIAEVQKATPQAPVYATIRPSNSPQNRPSSSSMRSSLNSLPTALNSTPLVKSMANEEPPTIHPTNPFYTTLPSNYSSASKLPVPNGRASFSGVDRTKKENYNDYSELKSPSLFAKTYDGPSSLPYLHHNENVNGYESEASKSNANASDPFSYDKFNQYENQRLPNNVNDKNPFETKRNSDPFEKYFRQENTLNGKNEFDTKNLPGSQSETNFNRREEITKTSLITEHKINEVEEVRTIKKIILNGSGDSNEKPKEHHITFSSPVQDKNGTHKFEYDAFNKADSRYAFSAPVNDTGKTKFDFSQEPHTRDYPYSSRNERSNTVHTPTQQRSEYYSSLFDKREETRQFSSPMSMYHPANEFKSPAAETPTDTVSSKPPVKPETTAPLTSPSKRKCPLVLLR